MRYFSGDRFASPIDSIDLGYLSQLTLNRNFALGGWGYDVGWGATGQSQTIISHGQYGWCLRVNTSGQMEFLQSDIAVLGTAVTAATSGVWNHHAVSIDSGNTGTFYLNGVADGTFDVTGITLNSGGYNAAIGRDGQVGTACWGGFLASVFVHVALTAQEHLALGKRGGVRPHRIRYASLKAYYALNGRQSPEPDYSSFRNDGTVIGTVGYPNDAPIEFLSPFVPTGLTEQAPGGGGGGGTGGISHSRIWTEM